MKKIGILFFSVLGLISCGTEENKEKAEKNEEVAVADTNSFLLTQGDWIGRLRIGEEEVLPFNMYVSKDSVYFINSDEWIGSEVFNDTVNQQLVIKMPIFDSEFRFSKNEDGSLFGFWHNYAKDSSYKIDFTARAIDKNVSLRFDVPKTDKYNFFDGNWETTFEPGTPDAYKALGLLVQTNQKITGTFLTETGDYRFLDGNVVGDSMYLSAFDGSHAFLFRAKLDGDTIRGMFYSGTHYQGKWKAHKNNAFEISDPDSLTKMKIGAELSFSFPGLDGQQVVYPSKKYANKVTIIQILGSWCPNCMDETKFLTDLHNTYGSQGLEVIGVAFETPKTLEGKIERVKELTAYFGAKYDFCIGGDASKKTAEAAIPAISKILAFPTTIFIDKNGVVRKIHTGFNGPGTGPYHLKFVETTNKFVQKLLKE
jgi:thiol-disulfide isomerase/thioredoxin